MRSPTKRSVSRTSPPRSFSPRGSDRGGKTLRHKRKFELKPSPLGGRDVNRKSSTGLGTSAATPPSTTSYTPLKRNLSSYASSSTRPKVETKTTYAVKPATPSEQRSTSRPTPPYPTSPPNTGSPQTRLYSTSTSTPQTRLYSTSSTGTPFSAAPSRPTPLTSPSLSTQPLPNEPVSKPERKRRHMGWYGNTPSPPLSPPRKTHKVRMKSRSPPPRSSSIGRTRIKSPPPPLPKPTAQARKPLDPPKTKYTTNYDAYKDYKPRVTTAATSGLPTSSAPRVSTSGSSDGGKRSSYRYPSLTKGTAATPKRRINVGMVPIDTTFSPSRRPKPVPLNDEAGVRDSHPAPYRPGAPPSKPSESYLQGSSGDLKSKYPTKQREGVVLSGEREKAYRGWLGGSGATASKASGTREGHSRRESGAAPKMKTPKPDAPPPAPTPRTYSARPTSTKRKGTFNIFSCDRTYSPPSSYSRPAASGSTTRTRPTTSRPPAGVAKTTEVSTSAAPAPSVPRTAEKRSTWGDGTSKGIGTRSYATGGGRFSGIGSSGKLWGDSSFDSRNVMMRKKRRGKGLGFWEW